MNYLEQSFASTGALHHAYFIEGDRKHIRPNLISFISGPVAVPVKGNPDFWHEQFSTFTIDDARDLRDRQANKAFAQSKKIFILEADTMTLEAQNAMLKMLEEPTPDTHFFIIMSSRDLMLPTVRSRMMIISDKTNSQASSKVSAFLSANPTERLKLVASLIEDKDRSQTTLFIDSLITELHAKKKIQVLAPLVKFRSYLNDRSPSYKLILEHVALTLPVL